MQPEEMIALLEKMREGLFEASVDAKLKNDDDLCRDLMRRALTMDIALLQDKQLDFTFHALTIISRLPCADGSTLFKCGRDDCPRCIAVKAVESFNVENDSRKSE